MISLIKKTISCFTSSLIIGSSTTNMNPIIGSNIMLQVAAKYNNDIVIIDKELNRLAQ